MNQSSERRFTLAIHHRTAFFLVIGTLTLAAAHITLPALAAAPGSVPSFPKRLWRFVGVLHPIIVHFPIALLIFGALAVAAKKTIAPNLNSQVINLCLGFGAISAVVAAVLGWSRATGRSQELWDTLFLHRWLGIAVAASALLLWFWSLRTSSTWQESKPRYLFVFTALALSGLVGFTGHLGGELVYGKIIETSLAELIDPQPRIDYSQVTTPTPSTNIADLSVETNPENNPDTAPHTLATTAFDPTQPVNFTAHVWPIFQAKCITCHGPEKQKGELRLDSQAAALEAPAYIAGNPEDSEMLLLITDPEDEFRMPPVGEAEPVTPEEYLILRTWIEQGASWEGYTPTTE